MMTLKRKIDSLGRVVLPNDLRESMGIKPNDVLLITANEDSITIRLQVRVCPLCGGENSSKGSVCFKCADEIKVLY